MPFHALCLPSILVVFHLATRLWICVHGIKASAEVWLDLVCGILSLPYKLNQPGPYVTQHRKDVEG